MNNIYEQYKILKKHSQKGYWDTRIIAEIGYLINLLYEDGSPDHRLLLDESMDILYKQYKSIGQIESDTAKQIEEKLLPLSEQAKSLTVICAAHAHIDMNWMWGYPETATITIDTVRTMLTLMDEYPEFIFSQSQASIYKILEDHAPELLAKVKERVKEGRWEVTASSWVENDKNMSGGEAMARHLLYTKQYLSNLFDIPEESLNLDFEPDTFGHSANLPEILSKGGITRYYHCRGYNGDHIIRWKAPSGAEILVSREPDWYGGFVTPQFCEQTAAFCKKYNISKMLKVYGVGDHGGGPSRRDIKRIKDMSTWPLFPVLKFGTYKEYFDYLETIKDQFAVVDQELNYIFTGCYTSQSRIKMANHVGENKLIETEILESMASQEIPDFTKTLNLDDAWKKVLFNQFHDILPGSGTADTREYAMGEFQHAMAQAGASASRAMTSICAANASEYQDSPTEDMALGAGVGYATPSNGVTFVQDFGYTQSERGSGPVRYVTVFNVTQEERIEPVEIVLWDWQENFDDIFWELSWRNKTMSIADYQEHTIVTDMEGNEYPFQFIQTGTGFWAHAFCRLLVWMPVPALGHATCRISVRNANKTSNSLIAGDDRVHDITDEPICLENDKIRALFDCTTMKCISMINKVDGKELITPEKPACGFSLITEEVSNGMTSWIVGRSAKNIDLNDTFRVTPTIIQTSGLRKELGYEIIFDDNKLRVNITLDEGCSYLKFNQEVVWTLLGNREKGIPQLRFMLPCSYDVKNYRYTIPFGILDRPALAQDVPAVGLGCAIPEEGRNALYLFSNTKYGFRGDRTGLSLNLIRSSYDPDPYPEVGTHLIHTVVGICDPQKENLARISEHLNHPLIPYSCAWKPDQNTYKQQLFHVQGATLSVIKSAEDGNGYIIRVYNPGDENTTVTLGIPGNSIEGTLCSTTEKDILPLKYESESKTVSYQMKGSEVCSFRIITKSLT